MKVFLCCVLAVLAVGAIAAPVDVTAVAADAMAPDMAFSGRDETRWVG